MAAVTNVDDDNIVIEYQELAVQAWTRALELNPGNSNLFKY